MTYNRYTTDQRTRMNKQDIQTLSVIMLFVGLVKQKVQIVSNIGCFTLLSLVIRHFAGSWLETAGILFCTCMAVGMYFASWDGKSK